MYGARFCPVQLSLCERDNSNFGFQISDSPAGKTEAPFAETNDVIPEIQKL